MGSVVVDMNNRRLMVGQTVKVHQDECVGLAKVFEVMPDCPTANEPGFWVDIDMGGGLQGMMSYILEVTDEPFVLPPREDVVQCVIPIVKRDLPPMPFDIDQPEENV